MLSSISNWILSITGVICLSVVAEFILPYGQTNKYVKGIFSFVLLLIIVSFLPQILNQKIDFSSIFNYESSITVDEDYLYEANLDKLTYYKQNIENKIKSHGYDNVSVYISCNIKDIQMKFKSITVDLKSLVISKEAEHKNIAKIREDITKIILSFVEIDEEDILYDI